MASVSIFNAKSITSGNTVIWMSASVVIPIPFRVEKIVHGGLSVELREVTNSVMGVDGNICHSLVKSPVDVTISLSPDSPTCSYLDLLNATQKRLGYVVPVTMTLSSSSISGSYHFSDGALKACSEMPDMGRVWKERMYAFTFKESTGFPVGISF